MVREVVNAMRSAMARPARPPRCRVVFLLQALQEDEQRLHLADGHHIIVLIRIDVDRPPCVVSEGERRLRQVTVERDAPLRGAIDYVVPNVVQYQGRDRSETHHAHHLFGAVLEDDLRCEGRSVRPNPRYTGLQAEGVDRHESPLGKAHEAHVRRSARAGQLAVGVRHGVVPRSEKIERVGVAPLVGASAGVVRIAMITEVVDQHTEAHPTEHESRHLLGVVVAVPHEAMLQHDDWWRSVPECWKPAPPSPVPGMRRRGQPPSRELRGGDTFHLSG
mmetsp:Transcript_47449/g.133487  ORF Transcript_47449/g.133487 Transcript_47449/m.133487 type:complete len:276 (+) Transcript_47449:289-1116(+)